MKYIFLDEKYWIDLRRFIYHERNAPELSAVVNLLTEKTDSGEWALPLSLEHINETRATFNPSLRQPLVDVMLLFSKGYAIKDFIALREHEIIALIKGQDAWKTPDKVIAQDPGIIFGSNVHDMLDSFLMEEGVENGSQLFTIMHTIYPQLMKSGVPLRYVMSQPFDPASDKDLYFQILEWARENGEKTELHFVFNRIRDYYTINQQEKILSYGLSKLSKESKEENRIELRKLLQKLPTFYSNCVLMYKNIHMQPSNKPFHKNDFTDMMYLAAMIPYCDFVLTEAKWVDLAKQAQLDKTYNTVLSSNIHDLISWAEPK